MDDQADSAEALESYIRIAVTQLWSGRRDANETYSMMRDKGFSVEDSEFVVRTAIDRMTNYSKVATKQIDNGMIRTSLWAGVAALAVFIVTFLLSGGDPFSGSYRRFAVLSVIASIGFLGHALWVQVNKD